MTSSCMTTGPRCTSGFVYDGPTNLDSLPNMIKEPRRDPEIDPSHIAFPHSKYLINTNRSRQLERTSSNSRSRGQVPRQSFINSISNTTNMSVKSDAANISGSSGHIKYQCEFFYTQNCNSWLYVANGRCAKCLVSLPSHATKRTSFRGTDKSQMHRPVSH